MPVKSCPLSDHLADNRRHVSRRERSQRFGADVAERAKAQVKRHGGRLIWRFDDCHDVKPSLRPKNVLHSHSKRLRHLLEGVCPLRGILGVADSLIGELRKHDICYHGNPPSLGPCATWHKEAVLRLPQQLHCNVDLYHCSQGNGRFAVPVTSQKLFKPPGRMLASPARYAQSRPNEAALATNAVGC